jgi:hypothetical protein
MNQAYADALALLKVRDTRIARLENALKRISLNDGLESRDVMHLCMIAAEALTEDNGHG